MRYGILRFEMMPALNSHPKFIRCLAELVKEQISSDRGTFTACRRLAGGDASGPRLVLCPWYNSAKPLESRREKSAIVR